MISENNWCLRLSRDYRRQYLERLTRRHALNLPRALFLALRAHERSGADAKLLRRLEAEARAIEHEA